MRAISFFSSSVTLELVHLVFAEFLGILYHGGDQIVGIDNRTLTALHLAVRQFDHAVGEVYKILAPLEAQTVQEDGKHLEVVVLLVPDDVDHLVDGEVVEAHLGRTDVLRHVDRRTVLSQQELLVQPLFGKVGPYGVVVLAEEQSFLQTFFHLLLADKVSVRLIVDLVEAHAQCLVGLVETGIHPAVHLLPQRTYLRVALLPLDEHLLCFV